MAAIAAQAFPVLATRHLFDLRLTVPPPQDAGGPAGAGLRVGVIAGGGFAGARLSGTVDPGGADWQTLRGGGAIAIDARIVLRTGASELVRMAYRGLRTARRTRWRGSPAAKTSIPPLIISGYCAPSPPRRRAWNGSTGCSPPAPDEGCR
jgi:hypothetical protein